MPTLQKIVIYLLILAVPVSAWPDVMSACSAQQANTANEHVHSSMMQPESPVVNTAGDTSELSEMECCEDCVAICAAFIGSLATSTGNYLDQYFDSHLRLNSTLAGFHTGPPPQALFRPPISLA